MTSTPDMTDVPARIEWAVETVAALRPGSVLEVGCGRGVALSRLAERLPTAALTGVDRSAVALAAAEERNRRYVESGRLALVQVPIEELTPDEATGRAPFDVVFAVNVNAFWRGGERELSAVRGLLRGEGTLLLFYEPPSDRQGERIALDLAGQCGRHGFEVIERHALPLGRVKGLGVSLRAL